MFKFVPTEFPDKEIINLCNSYGNIEGKVERQTLEVLTVGRGKIRVTTATRFVHMKLTEKFKNF